MPTIKPKSTKEIIDKIFGDQSIAYGLKEFENIDFSVALDIREEGRGVFKVKDLKSGTRKIVYDEASQRGKPEEIVRRLWLHKLHSQYGYPFDRIDTEKASILVERFMLRQQILWFIRKIKLHLL